MGDYDIIARADASFDLYPYTPSALAGWTFVIIFAIAAAVHFFYIFSLRSWFFIPLVLGCIGETFGYYGRAWSHQNIRMGTPYLLQLMLILGSAPLIAATVYMTLGRFIRALKAEQYSFIRISWVTKVFVIIDIGSFICQIMGSAMQGSGDAKGLELGQNLVLAGLGVQLFALSIFIIMAVVVHCRLNSEPTCIAVNKGVHWRRHLWALYGVSGLIVVRNTFRLIEFAAGHNNPLATYEVFLYIFDASLTSLVVIILAIFHLGRLLRTIRKAMPLQVDLDARQRLV